MNSACPICKFTNDSSSTACAKCGSPLTASASPRNYLNDASYDSPLARRVEKETLDRRVNWARLVLVFLGSWPLCTLPIRLTLESGPEQEVLRMIYVAVAAFFGYTYLRIAFWSRSNALTALVVGLSIYTSSTCYNIYQAVIRTLENRAEALGVVVGVLVCFFVGGILLNGVIAAARLRTWSPVPAPEQAPAR